MANPKFVTLVADADTTVAVDINASYIEVTLVANAATTYFNTSNTPIGSIASPPDGNHVLTTTLLSKVVRDETGGAASVVRLRSSGTPTVGIWAP